MFCPNQNAKIVKSTPLIIEAGIQLPHSARVLNKGVRQSMVTGAVLFGESFTV
jgi:hypothetical protein